MITLGTGIYIGFAILFLFLTIILIFGKGDMLIAGYNTANEKERKNVDIKKLRKVMALHSAIIAAYCVLSPFLGNNIHIRLIATSILILITLAIVILANTWVTKK